MQSHRSILYHCLFGFIWIFIYFFSFSIELAESVTIKFTYDAVNRLTSASYGTSQISYTYDSAGNLINVASEGEVPDSNSDGNIDLADVVTALQIMTGISPIGTINLAADINGDGRIGMAEALYVLQVVARMRTP